MDTTETLRLAREIIEQLMVCHDDPRECAALEIARETIAAINAALSQTQTRQPESDAPPSAPQRVEAWQPIKTAPKDGTAFFACLEASDIPHAMRFDGDDLKLTWDGHLVSAHDWPTHWMPLPAPPTEAVASPSECDSLTGQEGEGA